MGLKSDRLKYDQKRGHYCLPSFLAPITIVLHFSKWCPTKLMVVGQGWCEDEISISVATNLVQTVYQLLTISGFSKLKSRMKWAE